MSAAANYFLVDCLDLSDYNRKLFSEISKVSNTNLKNLEKVSDNIFESIINQIKNFKAFDYFLSKMSFVKPNSKFSYGVKITEIGIAFERITKTSNSYDFYVFTSVIPRMVKNIINNETFINFGKYLVKKFNKSNIYELLPKYLNYAHQSQLDFDLLEIN